MGKKQPHHQIYKLCPIFQSSQLSLEEKQTRNAYAEQLRV